MSVLDDIVADQIRTDLPELASGDTVRVSAKVVEGKADMVVNYSLEPWEIERGFVLTCQAVPKSERLVLDYDAM